MPPICVSNHGGEPLCFDQCSCRIEPYCSFILCFICKECGQSPLVDVALDRRGDRGSGKWVPCSRAHLNSRAGDRAMVESKVRPWSVCREAGGYLRVTHGQSRWEAFGANRGRASSTPHHILSLPVSPQCHVCQAWRSCLGHREAWQLPMEPGSMLPVPVVPLPGLVCDQQL